MTRLVNLIVDKGHWKRRSRSTTKEVQHVEEDWKDEKVKGNEEAKKYRRREYEQEESKERISAVESPKQICKWKL